jgi:hypothetical protein
MGTPRVQHSALPPPAPSRPGTESLWHRAPRPSPAPGPRATPALWPLTRPPGPAGPAPGQPPPRITAWAHSLPRVRSRGGGCPAGGRGALKPAELQRPPSHHPVPRPPHHRLAVAPSRCGAPCLARNSMESLQHRVAVAPPASSAAAASRSGTPCLVRSSTESLWHRVAVAPTRCGTDSLWHRLAPAPSRCAHQTAPAPAPLSLRTQRLGMRGAHDAPPRASPPRAQAALRPAGPQPDCHRAPRAPRATPAPWPLTRPPGPAGPAPRPNCTGRRPITPGLAPSSDSPHQPNGPCASCAVATHSAARHARRTRRAPARLATSCAGGPSARGSATRLSASGALPRPCPGLLRVGASPLGGARAGAPRRAEPWPSRRGSGCSEARPSSGEPPLPRGTAGSRRTGRTCRQARRRRARGWGPGPPP